MSEKLGNGVSRTLSALGRNFSQVIWQKGKPPLDSELNLMSQIESEKMQEVLRSQVHSGFFLDPTLAPTDFITQPNWSNFFNIGEMNPEEKSFIWACVNGWVLPIASTDLFDGMSENTNVVKLNPPPASDTRVDLVFLEVWTTPVAPNPSEENKPSKDKVYRYGNVECQNNIADDIQDSTIGYETTERLQVQYRIRVFGAGEGLGSGVALDVFPDGLDDPNVLGQGTNTAPIGGMVFSNMKNELGDPSLWRAGDGNPENELGTSDGYVYAVPVCAVFRRNHSGFVAVQNAGNAQKNGGLDRLPSTKFLASPRQGAKVLSTPTLHDTISPSDTGYIQVDGLIDSGIDDIRHYKDVGGTAELDFFVEINGEIMRVIEFDTVSVPALIKVTERGRYGTQAKRHVIGSSVRIFNSRPDGKFADEIHKDDILDLRRGLNMGDWDYTRLLLHNLRSLVQGQLKTSYKQAGTGDTEGHSVLEVSFLHAVGSILNPNQTEPVDGPDGIRTVWSDGATIQSDVTMLLDKDHLPLNTSGAIPDMSAGTFWDVTADFKPRMFTVDDEAFCDGSTVFLHIGGDDGNQGARYTFRDSSERKVRFVSPKEMWNNTQEKDGSEGIQSPVRLRWLGEGCFNPAAGSELQADHLGDMYPTFESNFTKPFIFLGDVLNPQLKVTKGVGVGGDFSNNTSVQGLCEIDMGIDFDDLSWSALDPSNKLLNGSKTLRDMLTDNGRDFSGNSSEVYLVIYGDGDFAQNNGAFKVVGVGTADYTYQVASSPTKVVVEFLTEGVTQFDLTAVVPTNVSIEFRSPYCTNQGGNGFTLGTAAATITFTGLDNNEWQAVSSSMTNTGSSGRKGYPSSMVINSSLIYNSGRGAMARRPDEFLRFAVVDGGSEYLRQAPSSLDINFPPESGVPDNEIFFDYAHVQVWNRLGSLGLHAPEAPSYGGQVLAFSEQDREAEVFFDNGSKTVIFRPFLDRAMTLQSHVLSAGTFIPNTYVLGHAVDGAGIFESTHTVGFALPPEYMPRFGRQDIPFYNDTTGDGSGTFITGINHLFSDNVDNTKNVFYIIGGFDNGGAPYVGSMLFQTGATSGLDYGVFGNGMMGSVPPNGDSAYQARLVHDDKVVSSDFGKGLRGIELPPYLGIARIYGVYDRRDWVNKGASFESNRLTVAADPATNLLKTDVTKQTLFIRKGGGNDATGLTDSHTYVVPSELIDITRSPEWSEGENFQDLEYIVECVVFGFGEGFINYNNYVMARQHAGNGANITQATALATPYVLTDLHMCIPSPAPKGDKAYVLAQRTVYQGDAYMTRAGAVRTVSDYEHRYGEVAVNLAQKLEKPIQQTDVGGNLIVDLPNPRQFQVLASVDFYTTLGTGKIGGKMYKGTPLDIGHKESVGTRKPQAELQMVARTFTEGQMKNTSRASLEFYPNTIAALSSITIIDSGNQWFFQEGSEFNIGATNADTMEDLAQAIGASTAPVHVIWNGESITLLSKYIGERGNQTTVSSPNPNAFAFRSPYAPTQQFGSTTSANLMGGMDLITNAGNGTSQLDLTGMTERLPLGVLLQDHDFLCENPLNDMASAFVTMPSGIRPPQTLLPLTNSATSEAERFLGVGQNIVMVDGGINLYEPYDIVSSPTGTRKFRTHRGGAAYTVSQDPNKTGSPIDFYSTALHSGLNPILKGCVLAGKALLVRNFVEHAFAPSEPHRRVSTGDEIQMVILTHGLVGSPDVTKNGLDIQGLISPTGYGEGYSAIDRYRLIGKPMYKGRDRVPTQLEDQPIIYPYETLLDTPDLEE